MSKIQRDYLYGYSKREIADYLGMYFTSISRIMHRR
jgi:hypothetical protein